METQVFSLRMLLNGLKTLYSSSQKIRTAFEAYYPVYINVERQSSRLF